jgi:hypothetical protein
LALHRQLSRRLGVNRCGVVTDLAGVTGSGEFA